MNDELSEALPQLVWLYKEVLTSFQLAEELLLLDWLLLRSRLSEDVLVEEFESKLSDDAAVCRV